MYPIRIILSLLLILEISLPFAGHADTLPLGTVNILIPLELKGLSVDVNKPFVFDMIIQPSMEISREQTSQQSLRLAKYFLSSLAIPKEDMWVNLSPYEKDRIVPPVLGHTVMGLDMLAQDYHLKQISANLLNPDTPTGKEFWKKARQRARDIYGRDDVPINTLNKVWIIPDKAVVYERMNQGKIEAFIVQRHLKVMLEADYLAQSRNTLRQPGDIVSLGAIDAPIESVSPNTLPSNGVLNVSRLRTGSASGGKASQGKHVSTNEFTNTIMREVIIPVLEEEVNQGKNFTILRQIYDGMILSTWYKRKLKSTLLSQSYMNKNKIKGLEYSPSSVIASKAKQSFNSPEQIYQAYLSSFKKGTFNFIKEESDDKGNLIPRKYFSGGLQAPSDEAIIVTPTLSSSVYIAAMPTNKAVRVSIGNKPDVAMTALAGLGADILPRDLPKINEVFHTDDLSSMHNLVSQEQEFLGIKHDGVTRVKYFLTLAYHPEGYYFLGVIGLSLYPQYGANYAQYVIGFDLGTSKQLAKAFYAAVLADTDWKLRIQDLIKKEDIFGLPFDQLRLVMEDGINEVINSQHVGMLTGVLRRIEPQLKSGDMEKTVSNLWLKYFNDHKVLNIAPETNTSGDLTINNTWVMLNQLGINAHALGPLAPLSAWGDMNNKYHQGIIEEIPEGLKDGSFDDVIINHLFDGDYFPFVFRQRHQRDVTKDDYMKILQEIHQTLKKGGKLYLIARPDALLEDALKDLRSGFDVSSFGFDAPQVFAEGYPAYVATKKDLAMAVANNEFITAFDQDQAGSLKRFLVSTDNLDLLEDSPEIKRQKDDLLMYALLSKDYLIRRKVVMINNFSNNSIRNMDVAFLMKHLSNPRLSIEMYHRPSYIDDVNYHEKTALRNKRLGLLIMLIERFRAWHGRTGQGEYEEGIKAALIKDFEDHQAKWQDQLPVTIAQLWETVEQDRNFALGNPRPMSFWESYFLEYMDYLYRTKIELRDESKAFKWFWDTKDQVGPYHDGDNIGYDYQGHFFERINHPAITAVRDAIRLFVEEKGDRSMTAAPLATLDQIDQVNRFMPIVIEFLKRKRNWVTQEDLKELDRIVDELLNKLPPALKKLCIDQYKNMISYLSKQNADEKHPMILLEAITLLYLDAVSSDQINSPQIQALKHNWMNMIEAYNASLIFNQGPFMTHPDDGVPRQIWFGAMDPVMILMVALAYVVPDDQLDLLERLSANSYKIVSEEDQIKMAALSLMFMGIHFSDNYNADDAIDFHIIAEDLKIMRKALSKSTTSPQHTKMLRLGLANLLRAFAENYKEDFASFRKTFFDELHAQGFTKKDIDDMLVELKQYELGGLKEQDVSKVSVEQRLGQFKFYYNTIFAGLGSYQGRNPSDILFSFYDIESQQAIKIFLSKIAPNFSATDYDRYKQWAEDSYVALIYNEARRFYQQHYTDPAIIAHIQDSAQTPGGIDFNEDKLDLDTQGQVAQDWDKAMATSVTQLEGFTPVIISIEPYRNSVTPSLTSSN